MENISVLYYDGLSAQPAEVRVLLSQDGMQLFEPNEERLIHEFPFTGMSHNEVGQTHYAYLDAKGLQYLQFLSGHPLAMTLPQKLADANPYWGQKLMKQKVPVLLLLAVILGIGIYFLVLNVIPFLGMRLIGVQQEIVMGNKLKEVMLQETSVLGAQIDSAGTARLQAFADKLNLSTEYPIQLTLVKSDIVNAYALPGGQIVVYQGILKKMNSPEALAALLAHESSHVNQRHSLRSLLRNAASGIIIAVIFNDATGISGALVSNANTLNGLRYSRSLEAEADSKALDLLIANHVNANGMKELMEELQKEGDMPSSLSFFSSHPLTRERINNAKKYIKEHPQNETQRKDLKEIFEGFKN